MRITYGTVAYVDGVGLARTDHIVRSMNTTAVGDDFVILDIEEVISWITDEDNTITSETDKALQAFLRDLRDMFTEDNVSLVYLTN